jgi:glycosyltransferase involved in cell wall biosynthesis
LEILFLGLFFKEEDENSILRKSKVGLNNSTNTFQWNIIKGLAHDKSVNVKILNSIPCGNYPFLYNELLIKSNKWTYGPKTTENIEIGFVNFYHLKHIIRFVKFKKEVKEWIKNTSRKDRCIMMYDMYVPFMKIIKWVSRQYPDIKTNIIIGDLPNEYSHNHEKYKNTIKGYFLNKRGKKSLKLVKYFKSFVLLTKYMRVPLGVEDKPFIVIEGIVDSNREDKKLNKVKSDKKIIMYAGTLNKKYGIDTLLEAFSYIENDNYELWLCGNGDMKNQIIAASKKDKRIKYYGYVTRNQLIEMEKKITVYVNPRKNIGIYTKYSFPSKTIEYLASGKPIIMYKLDGIPEDYDEFLFYVNNDSASSLSNKIKEVCNKNMDELHELGLRNQDFVFEEKNNIVQVNKLLAMLRGLSYEE